MNHKPTPQGEEMSKHPPRYFTDKERALKPRGNHNYLGFSQHREDLREWAIEYCAWSEAQEMAERAREEGIAFGRLQVLAPLTTHRKENGDTEMMDWAGSRYWFEKEKYEEKYGPTTAASSKPSPQGGGEKKEGSNGN